MNRAELVRLLTTPIYEFHQAECPDGSRCCWCPAAKVADTLLDAGLIRSTPAELREILRPILSAHGRAALDEIPGLLDEIVRAAGAPA